MSSRSINNTLQVHTAFFPQASWSWAATSMLNSSTNTLEILPIGIFYKWPNLGYTQDHQIPSPNSPTLSVPILLPGYLAYPATPMFPHNTSIQSLAFILTSDSSKRSPAESLPQPSPFWCYHQPPIWLYHHTELSTTPTLQGLHSVLLSP